MITSSKWMYRTSLFAAALAFATVSPRSHAQDVGLTGQIKVPFAFETATGQHFNAGTYNLQIQNMHMLLIKGQAGAGFAMTTTEDNAQPAKTSKATFRKYGSTYFLSEISVAGESRRVSLRPSKRQKQMEAAATQTTPGKIELALLRNAH